MSSIFIADDTQNTVSTMNTQETTDFDSELSTGVSSSHAVLESSDDGEDKREYSPAEPIVTVVNDADPGLAPRCMGVRQSSDGMLSRRSCDWMGEDSPGSATCVESIPAGSKEWNSLIKPFVSDLAFRSFTRRHAESDICFEPYSCEAAILFVDLSGYSKINAALASSGAHALSSAVNEYFDRLIVIIEQYGGDIVKFAGDLVFVVWDGAVGDDEDLEYNLLCASQCALDLQEKAGSHPVKGTNFEFRIHCGLTIGVLESEVFASPSHAHMQRLYHSVSGHCLTQISELVDLAGAGEIAVSQDVADFLGEMAVFDLDDDIVGGYMLLDLQLEPSTLEAVEQHIEDSVSERLSRRIPGMEEEFIHPKVLGFLKHNGNDPTQIAQMRNLVTLFIGMTSGGNSVNWLLEVQSILDKCRCPIVQLINDDKGVHVVAAVNLYESVPDSSLLALNACRELVDKQIGCAIGVAMGPTFCGVTGSRTACRWDITGAVPVRAARLMGHALAEHLQVVIDSSLLSEPIAATRMSLLKEPIRVKGTEEPIAVYRLSGSSLYAIFRVLENPSMDICNRTVQKVRKSINTAIARSAVIVTSGPGAGQTLVCQKAATLSDLVPFGHVCDETAGMAQLARSIAIWYSYAEPAFVRAQAAVVLDHMDNNRWSRAHDECVNLLDMAIQAGLRACFVLRRIQFLDSFSLSIIHECLKGITFVVANQAKSIYRRSAGDAGSIVSEMGASNGDYSRSSNNHTRRARRRRRSRTARMNGGSGGKVVFLGCHTTLYQHRSAEQIVNEITRSNSCFQVKTVELSPPSIQQKKASIRQTCDIEASDRWIRHNFGTTAGLCISSLIRKANRTLGGRDGPKGGEGTPAREILTTELRLDVSGDDPNDLSGFGQISGGDVMKLTQSFDELSPVMQIFLKVVAIASRHGRFDVPKTVALGVTNDLMGITAIDSSRSNTIMKELEEMYLLRSALDGGVEMIVFPIPALSNIVMDVCTPVQIQSISAALIFRLESVQYVNFKIPFMIAELCSVVSKGEGPGTDEEDMEMYWRSGVHRFDAQSQDWDTSERDSWAERISQSIRLSGGDPNSIMGDIHVQPAIRTDNVPTCLLSLKSYVGPISFGPIGHTLSAISRTLFQAYGARVRKDAEQLQGLAFAITSATKRYKDEVKTIESILRIEGQPIAALESDGTALIEKECAAIESLYRLSSSAEDIAKGAESFLCEFVPTYVVPRIERLRCVALSILANKPDFLTLIASETLSTAFQKLQGRSCWKDSTEDALMTLATRNWKPAKVPEYLPQSYYWTVCNLRDAILRQRGRVRSKSAVWRHESTFDDMAAFLIASAALGASNRRRGGCRRRSM